jgi:ABC-type proline/glycine betaine transport system permease subunit
MTMRGWLVRYLVMATAGVAALFGALWGLGAFSELGLSEDGTAALVLAVGFTALLSVVLMGLVFYSGRSGSDERVIDAEALRRNEQAKVGERGGDEEDPS